jgi:hypothetical protein
MIIFNLLNQIHLNHGYQELEEVHLENLLEQIYSMEDMNVDTIERDVFLD